MGVKVLCLKEVLYAVGFHRNLVMLQYKNTVLGLAVLVDSMEPLVSLIYVMGNRVIL